MSDSPDDSGDGPLPMFAVRPVGKLAGIGAATGFIAVGTILVEIVAGRLPARMLGYSTGFISLPLGVAIPIVAALTARSSLAYALPALGFGLVYWVLFAMYV